jgi:hypothetical protein
MVIEDTLVRRRGTIEPAANGFGYASPMTLARLARQRS